MLPHSMEMWPTFFASKQKKAESREIYFMRIADSNGPRFEETVMLLRDGNDVISTGLSGIGKSTEVNGLLMVFLSHLGESDWPKEVWYRVNKSLLMFCLVEGVPVVESLDAKTKDDVLVISEKFQARRPVLLMELMEDEVNPSSAVPTYIPLSNREVFAVTKEMQKADAKYLLVDPPSCEDLENMAAFEAAHGSSLVFKYLPIEEVKDEVRRRVGIIGPKIRSVFQIERKFNYLERSLDREASNLFDALFKISVQSLPQDANNYLGAFVLPGAGIPPDRRR